MQRSFSKLASKVEWGTLDGSEIDIEIVNLEENRKSPLYRKVFIKMASKLKVLIELIWQTASFSLRAGSSYDEVYVEYGTAVGASSVIEIEPHKEHNKFSDDEEFLSKFPDIVTRVCATNRNVFFYIYYFPSVIFSID